MCQLHAPAWVEYYKPGRSYNDIECFDVRKAEFSVEEMERKKRAEQRERQAVAAYVFDLFAAFLLSFVLIHRFVEQIGEGR